MILNCAIVNVQRQPRCIDSERFTDQTFLPAICLFFLLCWQIMWGCCSQEPDFEIVYLCVCMCVWRFVCVWGVYWGICEAQISISVQWLSCETELPLCRVDKTWCPVFLFSTLHCGSCWFHWTLCCTYNNVAETIFWFRQWTQNNIFQNHLSSFFLQIT